MAEMLENFSPCVLSTDLEGTMRDIHKRLTPPTEHWHVIRKDHPGASSFDIERSIIQNWDRRNCGEPGKYGLHWWQHVALFMIELIPSTILTPAFIDELIATEVMLAGNFDLVNLIGAKSSGKSAYMARIGLTLVAADPDFTRCYVAAPFKNVADYTIWSEMLACFREIEQHHKDVFPEMKETASAKLIELKQGHPKAGRIDLIGLDNVAKLQGTKSRDQTRGFMILIADEIAVFPTQSFLQVLDNVTGNKNFIGFTGCNFKSTLQMDGILCNPRSGEYGDLDPDKDHLWVSSYNSITMRLDGHLSPNVIANREIYPFLLTEPKRANMETQHGLRGPKYLEQIRSFPHHGVEDLFVLSMDRLRSGGAFDDFWQRDNGPWLRIASLDPGWQGDPCKIGAFEFGPARVQAHDGSVQNVIIFRPLGAIRQLKVEAGMKASIDFLSRLHSTSEGPVMIKEGYEVTMDMQIAVQAAEFLREMNVSRENFCFDSSCRGSITQELVTVLGPRIMCYDLVSVATDMVVDSSGATARERYRNLRSECYFTIQLLVAGGQLRGAGDIMDALGQACRHRVVQAGMKLAIEAKDKYKEANQGKSPDSSDVLSMAVHAARRRGMQLGFSRSAPKISFSSTNDAVSIRTRSSFVKLRH